MSLLNLFRKPLTQIAADPDELVLQADELISAAYSNTANYEYTAATAQAAVAQANIALATYLRTYRDRSRPRRG